MKLPKKIIKPLAIAGYAARGTVYLIIGVFAVLAARDAAQSKDTGGALRTLLDQPFGHALTWMLVTGLTGYVVWRLIQSLFDTDDHGTSIKGLAIRGSLLVSAFTYGTLALLALSLMGVFSGGGDEKSVADTITGFVGRTFVTGSLTLIFAVVAFAHWKKAWTQKYEEHFDASEKAMRFIHPVSMTGLFARGMVFAILSILAGYRFVSVWNSNTSAPGDNKPGLKDALNFVEQLPFGTILLACLGVGLIAFAAYSFIEAKWRRINVHDA